MQKDTVNLIKEISEPIAAQQDMYLVDVEMKHEKIPEIWILVDSVSGGVNVDVCSKISREIAFLMEQKGVLDFAYRLNVSSPGLARPLSDKRQYVKNSGRSAKVKYKTGEGYQTVEGILDEVSEESFVVVTDGKEKKDISFNDVVETKIIPKI